MSQLNPYGLSSKDYAKLYDVWRKMNDMREVFYSGDLRDLKPHIIQLTIDGKVVAEYARITDAQNESGVNASIIRNVCKGKGKTGGGYRWAYKEV